MLDGVRITPLQRIVDERGAVMHMLRRDMPIFEEFGEIYFSTAYPGAVKAWHYHKRATINYAVPVGRIRFVLYDDRTESPSNGKLQKIDLGGDFYALVSVPPGIWNGFAALGNETALVANCTTIPHDPDEVDRRETGDPAIPYDWSSATQ